jgi:hypothetical protein
MKQESSELEGLGPGSKLIIQSSKLKRNSKLQASMKWLCRMMGRDITVQSEAGKGPTFTVTLPVEVTASPPSA